MKPALAFDNPKKATRWKDMACGQLVVDHVNQYLQYWWPRMFGYHLLKIGDLSADIDSSTSKIGHSISVGEQKGLVDVIADVDDLPFIDAGVDVCVLAQQLEFAVDPHHILREADRVLIPNGYMVISGFNPISLAGLNRLIPFRRRKLPWHGRFFTPMRVKDWLNLLGYEVLDDQRVLFSSLHPKVNPNSWWFQACQRFANKYLTALGSVYVIVAKKRVHPLTPIRPKWQMRARFKPINVSTVGQNRS